MLLSGRRGAGPSTGSRPAASQAGRPAGRFASFAAPAAFGLYLVVVVRSAWVCDDAFITLRTVDNLVSGYGLRWNVVERVQAFTHPLWLAVVTVPYVLTREPYFTTLAVSLAVSLATAILTWRRFRGTPWVACAVAGILAASQSFRDYSTSGLENPLSHLLWIAFLVVLDRPRGSLRTTVGVAALAGLARLDSLALYVPAVTAAWMRERDGRRRATAVLGLAPLAAWTLFSLLYYGVPYPNTALAKLSTGVPAGERLAQGFAYLANSWVSDPITLLVIAAGVGVALLGRRGESWAPAAGIVLQLAYVVWVGGDFMSGRFLSLPLFAAACLVGDELARRSPRVSWAATIAVVAVLAVPPSRGVPVDPTGIADERNLAFACLGLFNGDPWGPKPCLEMREDGARIRGSGARVGVLGAVGIAGYYAGPRAHLFDLYALTDPLLARLPMVESDPIFPEFLASMGHPRPARPWRPGHFLRTFPEGYLETAVTGRNVIRDPGVAELWDRVGRLTRAPLLEPGRLAAILGFLVDRDGVLRDRTRPAMQPIRWQELQRALPDDPEVRHAVAYESRSR